MIDSDHGALLHERDEKTAKALDGIQRPGLRKDQGAWVAFAYKSEGPHSVLRVYSPNPDSVAYKELQFPGETIPVEARYMPEFFAPRFRSRSGNRPMSHEADSDAASRMATNLRVGSSIGRSDSDEFGLLSAFVGSRENRWLLTANHVIADNRKLEGDESVTTEDSAIVGSVVEFVRYHSAQSFSKADAAVCKIADGVELATPLLPPGIACSNPEPARPEEGEDLHFLNFRNEVVAAKSLTSKHGAVVKVNYGSVVGDAKFRQHIVIMGQVEKGDSGALVMTGRPGSGDAQPVGFIVGMPDRQGSGNQAVVCPLDVVFKQDAIISKTGPISEILLR